MRADIRENEVKSADLSQAGSGPFSAENNINTHTSEGELHCNNNSAHAKNGPIFISALSGLGYDLIIIGGYLGRL